MSHEEALDDETATILETVGSDDSKESNNSKKDEKQDKKTNDGIQWETNNLEDDDSEW